ncbi:MAG: acetylglutamate kinase, partial [Thiotrichaceae bacterium]
DGKLLTGLKSHDVSRLIDAEIIQGGMIPKINCALDAVASGISSSCIIDGRVPHAVLLELLTDKGAGTLITS